MSAPAPPTQTSAWTPPRPGSDPTPASPGIRIYAPPVYRFPEDGARWSTGTAAEPTAACACSCGHTRTASGRQNVEALAQEYAEHTAACPGRG